VPLASAGSTWGHECMSERKRAAKQKGKKRQITAPDSKAKKRHNQPMNNNNQKQWNKKIMKGGDNDVKLCTLLDKSTGKMLKDAGEVTDL